MSFISKLFRKTDPTELAADQAARAEADKPEVAVEPVGAEQAGPNVAEQPAPTTAETTSITAETELALSEAETEPGSAPAPNAARDDAWWEESTPPQEGTAAAAGAPETAGEIESATELPANGTQPLTSGGTQPLATEPAEQPDDSGDGGTRPLTSADVPMLAAHLSQRGLAVAALRDIGRVRSVNQDSIFAMTTTLPRESGDVSMGLFIVADGMGGHHGGEIASRLAISTVAHYVLSELVVPALTDGTTEALQPLIIAAVQEANRAIWEHAQTVGSDMGTTCTVALLLGRALYLGHVGDSRAYLATPTGLKLITNDHSTVGRLIQVGQLDPTEARDHPLRSQLYRTVGQQSDVLVDFTYQQIGDATHLLLASDGLWGMLGDDVLADVLDNTLWPHDACHELIARANLAGGEDNISAIVVSLPSQL